MSSNAKKQLKDQFKRLALSEIEAERFRLREQSKQLKTSYDSKLKRLQRDNKKQCQKLKVSHSTAVKNIQRQNSEERDKLKVNFQNKLKMINERVDSLQQANHQQREALRISKNKIKSLKTETSDQREQLRRAKNKVKSLQEEIVKQHQQLMITTNRTKGGNNSFQPEIGGRDLCVICQEVEKNILFTPCKHVCACESCAVMVTTCPLCRQSLAEKTVIFI